MKHKPLVNLNLFFKKEIDNLNNELDKLRLESNLITQLLANNKKENDSLQRLELNIDLINKSIKSLQRVSFLADRKHVFSQLKLYVKSLMIQEPAP
jgi:dynactin complex subunit